MPWFYPDPVFGWTFYAVVIGFLLVASYIDIGTLTIPKKLTVSMLGVGLLFSLVRGAWLGHLLESTGESGVVWHFARSPVLGVLDGFLCSLEGFVAAFVVFFILWRVRVMRGGDVKLMAALGVWVGPIIVLLVVAGSIPVLLVLGTFLLVRKVFRRGVQRAVFDVKHKAQGDNLKKRAGKPARRAEVLLAYSLPVAISAGVILAAIAVHDQKNPILPKEETPPSEQASIQP